MVGFATSSSRKAHDLKFMHDYCLLTRKGTEVQFICDERDRLYAVHTPYALNELNPSTHSLGTGLPEIASLLGNAKGSIVRTTLPVPASLNSYVPEAFWMQSPILGVTLYPIFQGKMRCELYNVTLYPINPANASANPHPDPAEGLKSTIGNCLIDARTGLFLEANKAFQEVMGLDADHLFRARCEELGMSDLLLLATLNADRKCFFQSQFRASDVPRWFLSESCKLDDHECIRIWSPNQVSCPESHLVGFQLARTYCASWKDKPERVLICDDNELLLDTCCSIMDWAQIGYDVAHNGKEALQQLERQTYQCVFLDLNMPRLNGFDTARLIRKSRRDYRSIPIIAMTATPLTQADLARQLKHFDAILQKPFDVEDVKASVRQARERLDIQPNPEAGNPSNLPDRANPNAAAHAHDDYEPTPFMKRFCNRPEVMEGLRNHMLRTLESHLAFLETLEWGSADKAATSVVQQMQSMSISIGAWKLATHTGILHAHLLANSTPETLDIARASVATCIEESLCFYNTVNWETFAKREPSPSPVG